MPKHRWPDSEDPLARYQEWADNRYNPGHWLGANVPPDTRGLWSTKDRFWLGGLYIAVGAVGIVMALSIAQDVTSFVIVAGLLLTMVVPGILMLSGRESRSRRGARRRRWGKR